jgi:hypothetical protein
MEPNTNQPEPSTSVTPTTPVTPPPTLTPAPVQPATPIAPATPTTQAPPVSKDAGKKGGEHSTLIAVILLLLLYPIGVIYMFLKTTWPKWLKILLTLPIILGLVGVVVAVIASLFR